jgi:hypothetical protein
MAQTPRTIPANYPQPLGTQILKADAQRQFSMLRQEIVTDLLAVLSDAREPQVRARLIKLVETHLHSGLAAANKAQALWPELEHVKEIIAKDTDTKPSVAKRHLHVFERLDRVQRRSLDLLHDSFENIQLILDRVRPVEPAKPKAAQDGS